MVSDDLITNTRRNMVNTLRDLSCPDRQREYRDAVPYVHVPIELACQWSQYSSLMREQKWFRDSLAPAELEASLKFDTTFSAFCDQFGRDIPDFDQLWSDPQWTEIRLAAAATLDAFA